MEVKELGLPGVKLLTPTYFEDYWGYYCETYSMCTMEQNGITLFFVQDNHSMTLKKDTIRGIHFDIVNIGNRQLKTFQEIMLDVQDVVCPDADLQFGCYPDDGYIDYSEIDLESLYRKTGFVCKADFRESIRKTAQWLIEQKAKESVNF